MADIVVHAQIARNIALRLLRQPPEEMPAYRKRVARLRAIVQATSLLTRTSDLVLVSLTHDEYSEISDQYIHSFPRGSSPAPLA